MFGSNSLLDYIYEMFEGRCQYCGIQVERGGLGEMDDPCLQACIDHIIPVSSGESTNGPSNIVLACRSCNSTKRSKSLQEFREFRARQDISNPAFTVEQKRWLSEQGFEVPEMPHFEFYGEKQGNFPLVRKKTTWKEL